MNNEQAVPDMRVFWRGTEIGLLRDYRPDMWYLEGAWVANQTEEAKQFSSLARGFIPSEVYRDHSKGTEISLIESEDQSAIKATVVSLEEDRLFVRVLFPSSKVKINIDTKRRIDFWHKLKALFRSSLTVF